MNVATLRQPQAARAMTVNPAARASALNALWLRLDRARAVALCIPVQCETPWELEAAITALAQATALAGAVSELLALALSDTQALEALV